jgi:hypothetical protein
MGGFVLAWFAGESIVIYRWARLKAPPTPGALALSSGLFLGLAVIAQYQPARTTATVTAWALDLAILLQVIGKAPAGVTGWPPSKITDPTVLLPNGASNGTPAAGGTAAGGTAAPPSVTSGGNGPVTGGVPRGSRGGVLGA